VTETYEYSTDLFGNLITKITDDQGGVKVSEVLVRPGGEREEMMQSSPYVL
jgi:hypothetical protein